MRHTIDKYAMGDLSVAKHGLSGKHGVQKRYIGVHEDARGRLNALTEEYRHTAQKNGDIILPGDVTKRKIYEEWCQGRGYMPQKINASSGQYKNPEDYDLMPGFYKTEEDAIANSSDERHRLVAKIVFSWTVFSNLWRKEFPHLKSQGGPGKIGKGVKRKKHNAEKNFISI